MSTVQMVYIYITKEQSPSQVISDCSMYQRYTQQLLSSVRTLRGPQGARGIPGFHAHRGKGGREDLPARKVKMELKAIVRFVVGI